MTPTLSCPHAEYRTGMVIYCKATGEPCAHVYFKRCKGWWALNPSADRCPIRRENHGENQPSAAGRSDTF